MARPIVLSNGELHVGINNFGLVHDFYYPYVGLENHSAGYSLRHKVGVYIDGLITWLDDGSWELNFISSDEALVGHTRAKHAATGIILEFDDFVDAYENVFFRNVHVVNLRPESREVRLFMHQAFVIGDSRSNTDTAQYLPSSHAILHYRGRRAFVVSARDQLGEPFDQYSIGLFGIEGHDGTYRDADDGELENNNVEHGRVDSTLRFLLQLDGHSSVRVHYWIAAGRSTRQATSLHKQILQHGIDRRLQDTAQWWHEWLEPTRKFATGLPKDHQAEFIKSAMLIKSHIDKRGAVIASTDTAMLNYSRDAYAYCWPRDGAYAVWPLIRLGYVDEPRGFFEFCKAGLHPRGYLMHKYRADGALGSSWHPYVHGSLTAPPIQEDETALVLYVFSEFYRMRPSDELLDEFYDGFVKEMADFLCVYIDDTTGLPRPTYDLWEEVFLTTTYTTAVTHAALLAAAELAEVRGDENSAVRWRSVADDIKVAAHKHLYSNKRKSLRKGLICEDKVIRHDDTIDLSSFYGAFMFGLFEPDSDELISTFQTIKTTFGLSDEHLGVPRYENDQYRRQGEDAPSNWWFITSMWLAQYYGEIGKKKDSERIIDWVQSLASTTGLLSEQIDPRTHAPLSVEPLTWSHAEYMATLIDMNAEKKR